ncbi:malto-oligosyltrehalose synthase [Gilvimarinus sp. F26214L]|uniref:malto-oligosyltrehalose synthase n=1 Tax=Gilvimarinus sp. DZF01 TaxID=3461371 RepID=UPI004045E829
MDESIRATLRLQLHKDFNFQDALAQVPYLARMGISHLYLSPIHTPRAGSTHGYDVVDYGAVSAELGGEEGFRKLVAELRRHGMGVIADLVPNHMAIGGHDNRAWLDLLEWGMQSHYADFFDVDWEVQDPVLRHRIHAPFLGKPYGEVLDEGELTLHFNPDEVRFYVRYYDHHFPINPRNYREIFGRHDGVLSQHGDAFKAATSNKGRRESKVEEARQQLREALANDPALQQRIDERLREYDPAIPKGRTALHRLLERQNYRLAWWRTASDEINWRRFFDVTELAGIRVQELPTFAIVHATTFYLYSEGLIDGVRIDHIDGLADPRTYCRRLRRALGKLNHRRPAQAPQGKPIIYVEKILAPRERLSKEWQVDGDTGYAFMNEIGALLHHPAGEDPLGRAWTALTGQPHDFEVEERAARRRTVETILAADFNACALALHQVARADPHTRDWTLPAIRRVLTEILVEFPVYRTYMDARGRSAEDQALMEATLAAARRNCLPSDRDLVDYLDRWLGGEPPSSVSPIRARRARLRAIARFQQLSSPVAAKSVEDTAFYRYGHLLSRNEVGSTPTQFSLSARDFHTACRDRSRRYPHCMLATATHDHKRGEDVRARLAVISEVPELWLMQVAHWRQANGHLKTGGSREAPDAADEYMLYQMIVGAWPLDIDPADRKMLTSFKERVIQWQLKALREAKRNSNWIEPDPEYEECARHFVEAILSPETGAHFIHELDQFVGSIGAAGTCNSLTQVLVKLCAPGVPDIYQGCELWDFSFVDPDNRRPVDYQLRSRLLEELQHEQTRHSLVPDWRDGHLKQFVITTILNTRAKVAALFAHGTYYSLKVVGAQEGHVFCFAREYQGQVIIAAGVRFVAEICERESPRIPAEHWQDTRIQLPRHLRGQSWTDLFTDARFTGDSLPAGRLFTDFTVAALINDAANTSTVAGGA